MVKDIVVYPDSVLKTPASSVVDIDDHVIRLVDDMLDTMYEKRGIGLAAPQIGLLKRVIVVDTSWPDGNRDPIVLINPEIVEREGIQKHQERCLSLPGIADTVERSYYIKVKGVDPKGREVVLDVEGFRAVVFQHEIDHLNGIVFIDHLSRLKKSFYLRKLLKLKHRRNKHE